MPYLPSLGSNASLLDVFRSFPETSKPLIEYHEVLLRGPSPFTEAQRELIAAYVSGLNHCRYCQGVHTATAERLGVEEGVVPRLIENFEASAIGEMKPVLRYARKLTEHPASIAQADADAILAVGWDESAIFHTVAVTALFNFMNRLVEGLGIRIQPRLRQTSVAATGRTRLSAPARHAQALAAFDSKLLRTPHLHAVCVHAYVLGVESSNGALGRGQIWVNYQGW